MKSIVGFLKMNWMGVGSVLLSFGILGYIAVFSGGAHELRRIVVETDKTWILLATACIMGFWVLDGYVLHIFTKLLYSGYKFFPSLKTAMIGLLYNALTPFAVGGQPMQIYEMSKNGINAGDASSIITIKTILHQLCMTLYAVVAIFWGFGFFVNIVPNFWLFVVVGLLLNALFIGAILLVCVNKKLTERVSCIIVGFLGKMKLLKHPQKMHDRLTHQIQLFHQSSLLINKKKSLQFYTIALIMMQLTLLYLIPFCIYRSFNLSAEPPAYIICAMSIITMITAFVPLPGASGAAEGSFYLFFAVFFTKLTVLPAIFLWRCITYYFCILVGGVVSFAFPAKSGTL